MESIFLHRNVTIIMRNDTKILKIHYKFVFTEIGHIGNRYEEEYQNIKTRLLP